LTAWQLLPCPQVKTDIERDISDRNKKWFSIFYTVNHDPDEQKEKLDRLLSGSKNAPTGNVTSATSATPALWPRA
jgi:hypothetical protein